MPRLIHISSKFLPMFSSGTKSILDPFCRLARGNPQFPGVLGLSSESKLSQFIFLVDLKVQSKTQLPKWLNLFMAYLLKIGPRGFIIPKYERTMIATFALSMFRGVVIRKFRVSTHFQPYLIAWLSAALVAWEIYLVYFVI